MIDIIKKYQTRDGQPVEFITDKGREPYVIIGYIGDDACAHLWTKEGKFWKDGDEHGWDIIEVSPYADWEIDDKILVSDDGIVWHKRHFAGINDTRLPQTWHYGGTSWTCGRDKSAWKYAKKPDEDKGE